MTAKEVSELKKPKQGLAALTGHPVKRAKFVKAVTSPTTRTPETQFFTGSDNKSRDIEMYLNLLGLVCIGAETTIVVPLANVSEVE